MNRFLFVLTTAFAFSNTAEAQTWSGTTPGNIYYTGGNVGIGTPSATERLTLDGNLLVTGISPYVKISDRLTLQTSVALENGWSRGWIGQNLKWNDVTKKWTVTDQNISDFSMMRFENNGVIGFYAKANSSAIGEQSEDEIKAYRRLLVDNNGDAAFSGNLGVGLTSSQSQSRLHVEGSRVGSSIGDKANLLTLYAPIGSNSNGNYVNASFLNVYTHRHTGGNDWLTASTRIQQRIDATDMGYLEFNPTGMPWGVALGTANQGRLYIDNSGQVGIGTTRINDQSYQLFVEKGIRTRKVKVDQANWADYVFEPSYQLPTLQEVEVFIKANKHLPDVPSAKEVETNGLDVGDNQAVLLKKIEEQMLYILNLQKQLDKQQEEMKTLKKAVQTLSEKLSRE